MTLPKATLPLLLFLFAVPALGQAINLACASPAVCQFITDPFDLVGPQPTTCKLYKAGTPGPIMTTAVAAAPTYIPGAPVGSVLCTFTSTFAVGSYTLSAVASRSGFTDSAPSLPYAFNSVAPPPVQTPINLHPRNVIILP